MSQEYEARPGRPTSFAAQAGAFWNWENSGGDPLWIELICWDIPYDDSLDQAFTDCVEGAYSYWHTAVIHYREQFPSNPLVWGEMGVRNVNGVALGSECRRDVSPTVLDGQEYADL